MEKNLKSNEMFDIKTFSSDEKSVILLTPLFIVSGVEKDELSELITAIKTKRENYKPSDDLSVIYLDTIEDMKFTSNNSFLDINYESEGKTMYCYLDFENNEVFDDFIHDFNIYTDNAFESKTMRCTSKEAATSPIVMALLVAAGGSLLTFIVNMYHNYNPTRTMIVKSFVYYFYKFCKIVGPYPVAIATVIAFIFCMAWLVKSIKNPPMKTLFEKK